MIIRSRAPLRISFAGGGTDVSPYMEEQGGAVLNVTIDKYSYASLQLNNSRNITVHSLDYDIIAKYDLDKPLPYDGRLDLVKAVINRLSPANNTQGLTVFMHTDAPPGSGLGSSSSLVVSLVGLFQHWLHLPLTNYDIAELAYEIEREDMHIQGGRQDQYATTFGGVNYIEFTKDASIVNPLRIPDETLYELNYNLLLCYTGKTRVSAGIINSQVHNYVQRQEPVLEAMRELKAIAKAMKNNLLQGHLNEFGALLHEAWLNKQKMASEISTPYIQELYNAARNTGALGGKISGAGGGGFMMIYCPFERKHTVAEALEKMGARVVDFHFDLKGLQTWPVRT
ncbi:MAG: GHMP kinase [Anaerolineae bacterium]|nr:GHMP kinase [Anaerolineae bacterium]